MQSCIYEGHVRHRRFVPVAHQFSYRLFMMYLDLDELPELFDGRWLWSARQRAVARYCRQDYLGDPRVPLADAVRELVAERLGRPVTGPVRLLAQLRYFGYCFNPIALYFCYGSQGRALEAVVAEVNNTPWGERFQYVLDASAAGESAGRQRFQFEKQMHVSPFVPMDIRYRLALCAPAANLNVQLDAHDVTGRPVVDASLVLKRREISSGTMARALVRYPWMTGRIMAAIYFQAARLWWKGVPTFVHPQNKSNELQDLHA